METIEVNKKQLVAEYNNATESGRSILTRLFGEKFFSNKITDRVKSLDDVYTIKGTTYEDLIRIYPEDVISFKHATLIAEVLNEGWKPNWDNSNEYKYYPWFDMRSKSGFGFSRTLYDYTHTHTYVGSRLVFKSEELAEYAGKNFIDVYRDLLTRNK